jgi:hypothetical protein
MTKIIADVDIDVPQSFDAQQIFAQVVRACTVQNNELKPHPCGYYFQNMPVDMLTGLAAIPYEAAESLGYGKIDFLTLNFYKHFNSRDEITALLEIEPNWTLLNSPSIVSQLFQLAKHYELLQKIKPTSVLEIADCLALIRPGKKIMLAEYLRNKERTRPFLYASSEDGYTFKKSHAIAYSLVIVLQLHLLEAGVITEDNLQTQLLQMS